VKFSERESGGGRLAYQALEPRQLFAIELRVFSERHERPGEPAVLERRNLPEERHRAMIRDAHPAHAGIDVCVHSDRFGIRPDARKPLRIVVGVHGERDSARRQFGKQRFGRARHQQDRLAHTLFTQGEGFVSPNDRETFDVGIRFQDPRDDAVIESVAMVLDHGEDGPAAEPA
jgi:hypothetical protein